jgi:hypothetical protein
MSQVSLNGPPYGVDTIVVNAAAVDAVIANTDVQSVQQLGAGGNATLLLPDAAESNHRQTMIITNKAVGATEITVTTANGQDIIGVATAASFVIEQNFTAMLVSNGTHWYAIYHVAVATP